VGTGPVPPGRPVPRRDSTAPAAGVPVRSGPVALPMFLGGQVSGRQASEVTVEMEPLLDNPVAAGDAVAALRRYSLLSPAGNGLVLVHLPGSGRHPRATLSDAGARWRQAAAVLVEEAVPADPTAPGGGRVGVRAAAAARCGQCWTCGASGWGAPRATSGTAATIRRPGLVPADRRRTHG
jgi:hypothetical protein